MRGLGLRRGLRRGLGLGLGLGETVGLGIMQLGPGLLLLEKCTLSATNRIRSVRGFRILVLYLDIYFRWKNTGYPTVMISNFSFTAYRNKLIKASF